ncbi:MAG: dihydropteroate synthase [Deltaproteobacteria bacterium]|nr:dihydropteroate synthase [Deltaproteobacteria bacterium]
MHGGLVVPGVSVRQLFPDLGRRTLILGVVNVTPDSFSDGGQSFALEGAVDTALRLMDEGADALDIGGESTRPGSVPVTVDEELRRVIPVVEALSKRGVGPISVDTTKAEVARRALEAGASLVNDISGMSFDDEMPRVVAAAGVPVVLTHTRDRPSRMQLGTIEYPGGVLKSVEAALSLRIEAALAAGIGRASLVVDPGIGFGKTTAQNLEILRGLSILKRSLACPILVGTSRKAFIGAITQKGVEDRAFGTAASVALAIAAGADFVRVHDVSEMADVVAVADAVVRPTTVPPEEAGRIQGGV